MRVLVTGGLGYLGSALIPILQARKYKVTVLDNLRTQRYATLFTFKSDNPVRFIEGDVLSYNLEPLVHSMDLVIHLAAITDAAGTLDISETVYEVNYIGTLRVTEACVENEVKLIHPCSTSVYGVNGDREIDETCTEYKPQSPYAESKLEGTNFIRGRRGLTATVLRLGTVYGASVGWRNHTFVNKAIYNAVLGLPVNIWQTAMDQRRPYLYIHDMTSAVLHVIDNGLWGELYHVVSQNSTPREVVAALKKHKPKAEVRITTSAIMNQNSYNVSAAKLVKTGWTPIGDIESGIVETLRMLKGVKA